MTTTADALDALREYSVNILAQMAECAAPDTFESPGAELLSRVRDAYIEQMESYSYNEEDSPHQIADDAPSVYTHEKWLQFIDLAAYQEDLTEFDVNLADLDNVGSVALYVICGRLVHRLHADYEERMEEEDDEEDECDPDCCAPPPTAAVHTDQTPA